MMNKNKDINKFDINKYHYFFQSLLSSAPLVFLASSRVETIEIWYEFFKKNNIFSPNDYKNCSLAIISIMISFFFEVVSVIFKNFILQNVITAFLIVCKEQAS